MNRQSRHASKTKFLNAALHVVRAKGYAATTIDDICAAAELTKGSFFHHFTSKEDLALATAEHFSGMAESLFAAAPYHAAPDPVDRLLGYVDFRIAIMVGTLPQFTCLLGTMVQETYETHPAIRAACDQGMAAHIAELMKDIEAAKRLHAPDAPWSAESVGYFMQSVLQGSFIFAKARQSAAVAIACLEHLHRYLAMLFDRPNASHKENRS
jgi:TetR/AcrR family transcriptional repressor of nem operon